MSEDNSLSKRQKIHKAKMEKHKQKVDAHIAAAQTEKGVAILLTGNGKGKTSSAFGMVMRALGYQQKVGIVQFIKGVQECGEANFIQQHCPSVDLYQMGTGFTWNTQDIESDTIAAERTWEYAKQCLNDEQYDLVVLDELTYMLGYQYLDKDEVVNAIASRPAHQSVVVTGRGGGRKLRTIMDTIADIKDVRHAYRDGVKARKGVDY